MRSAQGELQHLGQPAQTQTPSITARPARNQVIRSRRLQHPPITLRGITQRYGGSQRTLAELRQKRSRWARTERTRKRGGGLQRDSWQVLYQITRESVPSRSPHGNTEGPHFRSRHADRQLQLSCPGPTPPVPIEQSASTPQAGPPSSRSLANQRCSRTDVGCGDTHIPPRPAWVSQVVACDLCRIHAPAVAEQFARPAQHRHPVEAVGLNFFEVATSTWS